MSDQLRRGLSDHRKDRSTLESRAAQAQNEVSKLRHVAANSLMKAFSKIPIKGVQILDQFPEQQGRVRWENKAGYSELVYLCRNQIIKKSGVFFDKKFNVTVPSAVIVMEHNYDLEDRIYYGMRRFEFYSVSKESFYHEGIVKCKINEPHIRRTSRGELECTTVDDLLYRIGRHDLFRYFFGVSIV